MTSVNSVDEFLSGNYAGGAGQKTVDAYRKDLASFARWFEISNGRTLCATDVTSMDLREHQAYLQTVRCLKLASVNRYLAGVRRWLQWAKDAGVIDRTLTFPKPVAVLKTPPKALNRVEQNRLIRALEKGKSARDAARSRLLMSCALRVGEAVTLKVDDLDIGDRHGIVMVRQGKANKWREAPVPPEARKSIRACWPNGKTPG